MKTELFTEIKKIANGMLPVSTYAKIYDQLEGCEGHIVEVGTAHGACTICAALALKDKPEHKVFSFEKILGGSREKFGSIDDNIKIIKDNFKHFSVEQRIELIIGDVSEESKKLSNIDVIGALILDADGRIDRDFNLFYDKLLPGGLIIIDDCDNRVKVKVKGKFLHVDLKHKLTSILLKLFESEGYLQEIEIVGNTYFGKKPDNAIKKIEEINPGKITEAYSRLIFNDAEIPSILTSKTKGLIRRLIRLN